MNDHTYVLVLFDQYDDESIEAVYGPFATLAEAHAFEHAQWPCPGPACRKVSTQKLRTTEGASR